MSPLSLSESPQDLPGLPAATKPSFGPTAATLNWTLVPSEMTGTAAPIVIISGAKQPAGTLDSAVAWAMLDARLRAGAFCIGTDRLIVAGAGDFPLAVAWLGQVTGAAVTAVVPDWLASERREGLVAFGAAIDTVIAPAGDLTPVHARSTELSARAGHVAFDRDSDPTAARFHAEVTAPAVVELVRNLTHEHVGRGKIDAFCFPAAVAAYRGVATGLKQAQASTRAVAVVGATEWWAMPTGPSTASAAEDVDCVASIDDLSVLKYLQLLQQAPEILVEEGFVAMERVDELIGHFDAIGMLTLFGAVKYARAARYDHTHVVVSVAPADFGRDAGLLVDPSRGLGRLKFEEAVRRIEWLRGIDAEGLATVQSSPG